VNTGKIIGVDERRRDAATRGVKAMIVGPPGVGKTSLLRTLNVELLTSTVLVDIEAGDLAIIDLQVPAIRIDDWPSMRDLACRLGGPNPSYPPTACYSAAHFEAVGGYLENRDQIKTLFVDSWSQLSEVAFRYCEQQPEAFSDRTGKKDLRGAYGLLADEMIALANQLQHIRNLNLFLIGILERVVDDFKVSTWQLQCTGNKTSRVLPGILDEIITMQFLDFGDGKPPTRGFVCTNPNPWGYPAKDRSGRLDQIEAPDLGKLLTKLTTSKAKEA
jgi:hypothetical protein